MIGIGPVLKESIISPLLRGLGVEAGRALSLAAVDVTRPGAVATEVIPATSVVEGSRGLIDQHEVL